MVTTVEVTEQVEQPTIVDESTIVVAPPEKLEGSILVGESIVVGPLPGTPGGPSSDGPAEFDGECADGNHGATVSSVATEAEPGKTHGEAVAAAAQSECGKDSTSEGDDTLSVDDDTPSVDDDTPSVDDTPAEDKSSSVAKKPSAPEAPADDKSKSKGDDGTDG